MVAGYWLDVTTYIISAEQKIEMEMWVLNQSVSPLPVYF